MSFSGFSWGTAMSVAVGIVLAGLVLGIVSRA